MNVFGKDVRLPETSDVILAATKLYDCGCGRSVRKSSGPYDIEFSLLKRRCPGGIVYE